MRRRKAVTIAAIGAPPFAACIGACGRPIPATTLAALLAAALTACSSGGSSLDSNLGVSASPRVSGGRMIAKGGGIYKVGLPYRVGGRWYHPRENPNYDRVGTASWYGTAFHGRRTSNGEVYNMYALTAGHPTLPMPSYAYVTNLQNGRTALVRINDRGPYARDRLIDLSYQTAHTLGFHNHGLARVRVRYAGRAPLNGDDSAERRHLAAQTWYRGSQRAVSDSTASISTGSVRLVRTLDVRPTGQAQAPSWSVTEYRQGELASARQANRSSRGRRRTLICASARSRPAPKRSACATCWQVPMPVPSRPREAAMIRLTACVLGHMTNRTRQQPWRESQPPVSSRRQASRQGRGQRVTSVDMGAAVT